MLERGDFRQNRDIGYYADKLCVTSKYLSEVCKKVSGLPAAFWITRYTSLDISADCCVTAASRLLTSAICSASLRCPISADMCKLI